VCQRIGTGEKAEESNGTGFLRTEDTQLLHPELKRRPLEAQSRGCTIWTCENPIGLLKNGQDVPPLNFLEG
jgi:hypothetical protein